MTEPAPKSPRKNGNAAGADAMGAQDHNEPPREQAADAPGVDLKQRLDQVGTILAKGLDLAEAGVSLGVTIISRVGVAAQQKIREGMDSAAAQSPSSPAPARAQSPEPERAAGVPEPAYGITNRLPLTPGGTVKISFSVNNDSMVEPKRVDLRVEGFVGDMQGAYIDAAAFSLKPAQKVIAPVDFEKFVLQGTVPASTAPDVYRGTVIVGLDEELRIPVVLVVMSP